MYIIGIKLWGLTGAFSFTAHEDLQPSIGKMDPLPGRDSVLPQLHLGIFHHSPSVTHKGAGSEISSLLLTHSNFTLMWSQKSLGDDL